MIKKQIERTKIENNWKKSEQHKLNFYKCNYEPIWEKAEQMNYDLCSYHYGKGAQIWSVQKTMTNSTRCVHKIHMLPCHKLLLQGAPSKIYNNERISPASCGGLFGAPMPYEYITSETAIRAPQVSNEMLERYYMNQTVLSTALHVKCPRCIVKSSWYASPISLHCRRQLVTLQYVKNSVKKPSKSSSFQVENFSGFIAKNTKLRRGESFQSYDFSSDNEINAQNTLKAFL
uniref:Uncharacterized protein n=1 Tax=Wuchereria bancrofti TaxID=6293 RepID=A0A1I8F0Y9_WUCBA